MEKSIKRGQVYYADLDPVIGSEQGGMRPVVIIQNNVGNTFSPTVIVAAITSKLCKRVLPTHVKLCSGELALDSVVLLEQIRTIDKRRISSYVGSLSDEDMSRIDEAALVSIGIEAKGAVYGA